MAENLSRIVLIIEYDGTGYCGFQYQVNAPTIQDELEKAIFRLTGEQIRVVAASRTDTGVHARGQVVSFRTGSTIKIENIIRGLNYYLPQDIAVKAAYKVNINFNVQREAVSRQYHYYILNCDTRSPIKRKYTLLVGGELDIEAMNNASRLLVGRHDFASFVTDINRASIKSTERTVFDARVIKKGDLVIFDITARSFLPHQVRNTVGSLIKVGQKKISIEDFQSIMEAKKPGLAGPTAPARGLFLMRISYPRPLGEYDENL